MIQFLLPQLSGKFLVRTALLAIIAFLFFAYLCNPIHVKGESMEPTYRDGSFNFVWRLAYLFSPPERFDVVTIRFAGDRVTLLKRVVALEGETVEFKNGQLIVDGKIIDEPYVQYQGKWNLEPRKVEGGKVYVVGDNRNVLMKNHTFGQTSVKRILGAPIW